MQCAEYIYEKGLVWVFRIFPFSKVFDGGVAFPGVEISGQNGRIRMCSLLDGVRYELGTLLSGWLGSVIPVRAVEVEG